MAKPLKIILALLGSLLLLLLAAVIALPLLFDPNDYRDRIAEAVKKETGREFAVGEIRLAVFPWLRVELREVTLGNAAGFGEVPMLRVQRADVGARLMPLLREKRIEASTLTLEGAQIQLAVDAEGRNNWQDLVPPVTEVPEEATPTLAERMQSLDIKGITLADVSVSYLDQQHGKQYQLDGLQLKTGRLHASEPFTVEAHFNASAKVPAVTAVVDLASTVALNSETGDVLLTEPKLELQLSQSGSQPMKTAFTLTAPSLQYLKTAQQFSCAEPLMIALDQLAIGPTEKPLLTAKGSVKTLLASDLAKQTHALKDLDVSLQLGGSAMPGGKAQQVALKGSLAADLAAQQATISGLKLAAMGLNASAKQWQISQLNTAPALAGDLTLATFEPRSVLAALGIAVPETSDAAVLKSASLNTQLAATSKSAALKNLTLKLDDTTLRGELAIRDFTTAAMSFALKADRLDADRYLPPAAKPVAAAAATPSSKAAADAVELPVAAIDKLNAQGTLEVASLKLKNLKLANVRLKLDGARDASHRQQLSASLYGGSADMALSVAPGAKHKLHLALSGINAGPLLKDFLDTDKLSGRGSLTVDVTTAGRTVGAVKRALDGNVAFNLLDGAVKGFNLGQIMRDGQALLAGQPAGARAAPSTDFAELRGAGVISNGVLKSDQLTTKNPLLRLEGAGEIDLVQQTINYLAKPTVVNTASGQGGKERVDLTGLVVPIRITGDLFKPKVSIDWQAALKQKAVDQLREKLGVSEETVREQREELRSRAKEEIGKSLLKLFGSKPAAPVAPAEPPASDATPPAP